MKETKRPGKGIAQRNEGKTAENTCSTSACPRVIYCAAHVYTTTSTGRIKKCARPRKSPTSRFVSVFLPRAAFRVRLRARARTGLLFNFLPLARARSRGCSLPGAGVTSSPRSRARFDICKRSALASRGIFRCAESANERIFLRSRERKLIYRSGDNFARCTLFLGARAEILRKLKGDI